MGATTIGFPCVPFGNGILGSGVVFADEGAKVRDWASNLGRIEGWRLSPSYTLYQKVRASFVPSFSLGFHN